jgi:hypothetical protein
LEDIKTLAIPSYTLADDFPQEHVKTFNDFLLFCASVEKTKRNSKTTPLYEHPVVKIRLELNNPVRYEDFLAAVPLSVSVVIDSERMPIYRIAVNPHYVQMFTFPSRNTFFVENILEPLSHDLANEKYRGYRFKSENLP